MKKNIIGLYIHIPFCLKKCAYCDFVSGKPTSKKTHRYRDSLLQEIEIKSQWLKRHHLSHVKKPSVDSIQIGGGTPSLLDAGFFEKILHKINNCFHLQKTAEITIEANPESMTFSKLRDYRSLGINRLSIGIQSFSTRILKILRRSSNPIALRRSIPMAQKAGFNNINVDLMYGIPSQTESELITDINKLLRYAPCHINASLLWFKKNTPIQKKLAKKTLTAPDKKTLDNFYKITTSSLKKAGYKQTDPFNFYKPNREHRFHKKFFNFDQIIGLGASAESFIPENIFYRNKGVRYINNLLPHKYQALCNASKNPVQGQMVIPVKTMLKEFIKAKLFHQKGLQFDTLTKRFGDLLGDDYTKTFEPLRNLICVKLSKKSIKVKPLIKADLVLEKLGWGPVYTGFAQDSHHKK